MASQLPTAYEPLLRAAGIGRRRATREPYDLALRVAELAGLDRQQARVATEAVLETLAVRISAGEVEDLMEEIPQTLHPALQRGLRESHDARRMSVDEFLDHIAERERAGVQLRRPARRPLVLPRRRPTRAADAHNTRTTG